MANPKLGPLHRQQSYVESLFGAETANAAPALAAPAVEVVGGQDKGAGEGRDKIARKSYLILRGRLEPLSKLRLISRHGEVALVDYGIITWVNLRPNGSLELRVNDGEPYTITLAGRGLSGELLDGLQEEKVEWIQELDELGAAGASRLEPGAGVVTGIYLKEGSVSREWSRGDGPSR